MLSDLLCRLCPQKLYCYRAYNYSTKIGRSKPFFSCLATVKPKAPQVRISKSIIVHKGYRELIKVVYCDLTTSGGRRRLIGSCSNISLALGFTTAFLCSAMPLFSCVQYSKDPFIRKREPKNLDHLLIKYSFV